MSSQHIGKVVQVIGPVLDIRFEDGHLPELLSAIEIPCGERTIVAEVAQHIGDNVARCVSMNATDGMVRGLDAVDTGGPITVPVGNECLGRIFNLLGQPIDELGPVETAERSAPAVTLGPIIHNPQVVQSLAALGVATLWRLVGGNLRLFQVLNL